MNIDDDGVLRQVADLYGLGDVESSCAVGISGTANAVHRVEASAGTFAVKRFQYTASDSRWLKKIRRSAEFELAVFGTGDYEMPQPVQARTGHIICSFPWASTRVVVRVHRWLDGHPLPTRPSTRDAAKAGAAQHRIQRAGARFESAKAGALLWWRWNPPAVLAELHASGVIDAGTRKAGAETLREALALVRHAEESSGKWSFCHYDIKPTNVLRTEHGLAVLDWDESFLCLPQLETVESALLWGGFDSRHVDREVFGAFIEGYRLAGGHLDRLLREHFGKFIASAVGWFDYLGRCQLGEFPGSATFAERPHPATVLSDLRHRLDCLDTWRSWL